MHKNVIKLCPTVSDGKTFALIERFFKHDLTNNSLLKNV